MQRLYACNRRIIRNLTHAVLLPCATIASSDLFIVGQAHHERVTGEHTIHIAHLKLTNFRNFRSLDLPLELGLSIFHGQNGQGKSNLLEAIYVLAIAKSLRASNEREMVNWQAASDNSYCQVLANAQSGGQPLKLQMDIQCQMQVTPQPPSDDSPAAIQKQFRVNGNPRTASGLVGELNAVIFTALDIDLILGSPSDRRRFLDILISQIDRKYLRSLQKYLKVLYQRNHLLRMIREGRSGQDELAFWDKELTAEGAYVIARRHEVVRRLSELFQPIHHDLTGNGEPLQAIYQPSVESRPEDTSDDIVDSFNNSLELAKQQEIARGVTTSGPHRDDILILIGNMDAGLYASRGQARTAALALRLAEARFLAQERKEVPVLLLDDVLSELDTVRRKRVLQAASQYQQSLVTTTDLDIVDEAFLATSATYRVQAGEVEKG